jgi:hypothetical protein
VLVVPTLRRFEQLAKRLSNCFDVEIVMSRMDDELDGAHLRELAAKCRRLSDNMSDYATASALRRMAKEYDALAESKDRASRPRPTDPISL